MEFDQWKKLRKKRRASAQESTSDIARLNNTSSPPLSNVSGRSGSNPIVTIAETENINRTPNNTTTSAFAVSQAITHRTTKDSRDLQLNPLGLNVVYHPEEEPL